MNFKTCYQLSLYALFIFLTACGGADDETNLVDLHTVANQDIISISFPADTETILSINSEYDFSLQGLKSNAADTVLISDDIQWSLSDGATSSIDQNGHFTASATAELITINADFGLYSDAIEIKVSDAKFDQVVELDDNNLDVDMCRSQTFIPIGSYIDEYSNEEIRPVDNIIINDIEWIIRDQEDTNPSQRAHIETLDDQATLHTLSEGNIIIQAKAHSLYSNSEVTSIDFNQAITKNNLNSIKLCYSSTSDLTNCAVTDASVEKDKSISFISVANYQALDGSDFNENISGNSKWGIDDVLNASIALSADRQQLDITGVTEGSNATISVACGDIEQAIDGIDISQGMVLDTPVSCGSGASCLSASSTINIDQLSVTSLKVSANDTELTSNQALILIVRPDEIDLVTTAVFSNNTEVNITSDTTLVYNITAGKDMVIEEKAGYLGIYTVLGSGTAEIKLDFRGEEFLAVIEIP